MQAWFLASGGHPGVQSYASESLLIVTPGENIHEGSLLVNPRVRARVVVSIRRLWLLRLLGSWLGGAFPSVLLNIGEGASESGDLSWERGVCVEVLATAQTRDSVEYC